MTDAYTTHREPVESCVFCRVIAGTLPASVVYQDDTEMAFMDMQPVTEGLLSYNSTSRSKMVLCTVNSGPPPRTVDTTIFEMWLGSLSTHRGLSIPAL